MSVHVVIQALSQVLIEGLLYACFRAFTADHLREGYGLYGLDVIPSLAHALEWEEVTTIGSHEHDGRMVGRLRARSGKVLAKCCPLFLGQFLHLAKGGSLALYDGRFQGVGSAALFRGCGAHAKVRGGQQSARVFDFDRFDAVALDLDLAELSSRDLALFNAVCLDDLCGHPAGGSRPYIGQGAFHDLLRGFPHGIQFLFQYVVILDLTSDRHAYLTPYGVIFTIAQQAAAVRPRYSMPSPLGCMASPKAQNSMPSTPHLFAVAWACGVSRHISLPPLVSSVGAVLSIKPGAANNIFRRPAAFAQRTGKARF